MDGYDWLEYKWNKNKFDEANKLRVTEQNVHVHMYWENV